MLKVPSLERHSSPNHSPITTVRLAPGCPPLSRGATAPRGSLPGPLSLPRGRPKGAQFAAFYTQVCVTSDALPHGKCRRDASACEGETNCTLHFPPIANCTAGVTGLDSFVFLGAYQPLYYAGDLDAPLRYNPSSGAPLCADKSSQKHTTVQYVPDTGPAHAPSIRPAA